MRSGRVALAVVVLLGTASCEPWTPPPKPAPAPPPGSVPGVLARLESTHDGLRTWQLVFAPHSDPVATLSEFVTANHVQYASYTGIGAAESATFAAFDPAIKGYTPMAHAEQMEILSFTGNVSWMDGKPLLHTHATFGKLDGTALGGHVLAVHVFPTLELVLTEGSEGITRGPDPSGAKLMKLDQPPPEPSK
jgi:predicted DNA-binding protein with PD1-like motif